MESSDQDKVETLPASDDAGESELESAGDYSSTSTFVNITSYPPEQKKLYRNMIRSHASRYSWKSHNTTATPIHKGKKPKSLPTQKTKMSPHNTISPQISGPRINGVGAGFTDPFQSYPSQLSRATMTRLVDYAFHRLWPIMIVAPSASDPRMSSFKEWFSAGLEYPTLFSALMHGAANHMHAMAAMSKQTITPLESLELAACEFETIQRLNEALQRADLDNNIDEIILAVNQLLFTFRGYQENKKVKGPFHALFSGVQDLDTFTFLSENMIHRQGLLAIIERLGGLRKMRIVGAASMVSCTDLLIATKNLDRPQLEYVPILGTPVPKLMDSCSFSPSTYLNKQVHDSISQLGLPKALQDVFQDMQLYTELVRMLIGGQLLQPDIPTMADQRNWIHHRVLCLPPVEEAGSMTPKISDLYEICRIGTRIYSLAVIFPVPAAKVPYKQLAGSLRETIQRSSLDFAGNQSSDLLIWSFILGGIASEGTDERSWYLDYLTELRTNRSIADFDELKCILEQIVWLDPVCDPGLIRLWDEHK